MSLHAGVGDDFWIWISIKNRVNKNEFQYLERRFVHMRYYQINALIFELEMQRGSSDDFLRRGY